MATLKAIAAEAKLDITVVRNVLKEAAGTNVSKATADKVFAAARKLGYDLRKLKVGKRMQVRRETLEEVINRIGENEDWSRAQIVKYLKEALVMVERVHKRVFKEEYGDDWL